MIMITVNYLLLRLRDSIIPWTDPFVVFSLCRLRHVPVRDLGEGGLCQEEPRLCQYVVDLKTQAGTRLTIPISSILLRP